MNSMKLTKYFILLVCLSTLLYLILDLLAPLAISAVFAVVFYPLHTYLIHRFKMIPWISSSVTTLVFSICFLVPLSCLVLLGVNEGKQQIKNAKTSMESSKEEKKQKMSDLKEDSIAFVEDLGIYLPASKESVGDLFKEALKWGGNLVGKLFEALISAVPKIFFSSAVILFSFFFFILDGKKLTDWLKANSPTGDKQTQALFKTLKASSYSVIVSSFVTGLVQMTMMGVVCFIMGIPNLLIIVLLTFLLSFIPILGTTPISLGIIIYLLITSGSAQAGLFLLFALFIGLSDNFVRPYFIQSGSQVHTLSAFVFTFGAITVLGFYGVFVGPLAAGLFKALCSMYEQSHKTYSEPQKA